ncbi:ATP12 family chaperone protein [Pelagibius sp.]|uniref:ATP12 family chaperone protein n=1 Tax=Pelagibius sp. TaxID=1931238 RepID=UPI003B5125D3
MRKIKRFYKTAGSVPADDGFGVVLDGRPLRTPAKVPLVVRSGALAAAIAGEWQAQGDDIDTASMALNNLACTAIDIVGPRRREIIDDLAGYGGHDLICYWSDEVDDLLRRQQDHWQPLLDWAAQALGAPLVKTCGVVSQDQPPESLAALKAAVESHDPLALTGLAAVVQASGSLVVGLALSRGRLNAEQAWKVSLLDELYQQERWGEDAEARKRQAALRQEIDSADRFLALLRAEAAAG